MCCICLCVANMEKEYSKCAQLLLPHCDFAMIESLTTIKEAIATMQICKKYCDNNKPIWLSMIAASNNKLVSGFYFIFTLCFFLAF